MKAKVLIFNAVIAAICLFSIVMYLTTPFIKLDVNFTITAETMEQMMGGASGGDPSGTAPLSTTTESGSSSSYNIDYAAIVGEDGIPVSAAVEFTSGAFFKALSLTNDGIKDYVYKEIATPNVKKIIEGLKEPIGKVVENTVKAIMQEAVKESLKDFTSSDDINTMLNDAGVDLNDNVSAIYDEFDREGSTVDTVVDVIVSQIDDVSAKLAQAGNSEFEGVSVSEENKAEMKNSVKDMLTELDLIDENGVIKDIDAALAAIMQQAVGGNGGNEQTSAGNITLAARFNAEGEASAVSAEEEIANQLTETLLQNFNLDEQSAGTVSLVLKIVAGVLIFSIATWAYIVIKIIAKAFSKNPSVKIWLPIWFGWILQFICFAINIVVKFVLKIQVIDIALYTSAFFAFVSAVALIVISVPYSRARKKLKKHVMDQKYAARAA